MPDRDSMAIGAGLGAEEANGELVLGKCDFFVDVQLWPLHSELDPRAWLSNFTDEEMPHAICLLNAFVYYSRRLVDEMFVASFQQLCPQVAPPTGGAVTASTLWRAFHRDVIVTHVEGETPNITDSGFAFARRARTLLGIPQDRILSAVQAMTYLDAHPTAPVLFVDDFVGTGNQFVTTWKRRRGMVGGLPDSFAARAYAGNGAFFYCPLICTAEGGKAIQAACPDLNFQPVHVIDSSRDGALGAAAQMWPDSLRSTATAFLQTASRRAGIPENGPKSWRGFGSHGLALAFEHTVPDATLPIFYWEDNGWMPLIRRR